MSAPVRRLIVVASRFPFGHQEAYLSAELSELVRHFERVAIMPVHPAPGPARHPVPDGVEVLSWPLLGTRLACSAAASLARRPNAMGALARVMASRDPGRIKNAAVALKALALGRWARKHGYDHLHAYWMSTPATVAMLAAAAGGITWSATAHRWDIYERNAFDAKQRDVAFVRTISERGADDLRRRMPDLDDRLVRSRLGIALPPLPPLREAAVGDEFSLACPAALVPVKGHDVLFEALAELRRSGVPVTCSLFGDGPLRERLEADAKRLGLAGAVRFEGFVSQDRLHEQLRSGRFQAVVLSSLSAGETMMEGVPSALIEAMALGVPVVASDSGSIGELVDDRCGRLVPPGDACALAAALLDVYRLPGTAFERAGRAYRVVSERHDVRARVLDLATAIVQRG